VDGPDLDAIATPYADDTTDSLQSAVNAPPLGFCTTRITTVEGEEEVVTKNGCGGAQVNGVSFDRSTARVEVLARPNPFVQSTELAFTLADGGRVRIEVFDVTGKRVATLGDRFLPAGRHRVTWSGRGSSGQPVPSGVYLIRVDGEGVHQTRKVVRVQ
jgi:hypothetical protein